MQILFVYSSPYPFVQTDLELLRERWNVREWAQPGRYASPLKVERAVRGVDLVFGWFASWHTFWPFTLAPVLRKPSVLVTGGFDTANLPDIGYGYQQGGVAKPAASWIIRRATKLVTNSEFTRDEVARNVGVDANDVSVVYHGVADPFGDLPRGERERIALTIGSVAWLTFERKGLRTFVEASRLAPDVRFVVVGKLMDDSIEKLRELGGDNVEYTGWVPDAELSAWFRRASVYVQPSRHEGFGISVAEAMLAGCVPVVSTAGALPEVVGDVGVQLDDASPSAVAEAVRAKLDAPEDERARARERVLERFTLAGRRKGLYAAVEEALSRSGAGQGRRA